MSPTQAQLKLINVALWSIGYEGDERKEILKSAPEWYPIWLEFKAIALKNMKAGIGYGMKGYLGQMQILGEIRKMCPARGAKPYEVNNNLAPLFARLFNQILGKDYFELRGSVKREQEAA